MLPLLALVLVACGLGGASGAVTMGFAVNESDPALPISEPIDGPVAVGQRIYARLEVPAPLESDRVTVSVERRVVDSYIPETQFEQRTDPPWTVLVVSVSVDRRGEWLVAFFSERRKLGDAEFTAVAGGD